MVKRMVKNYFINKATELNFFLKRPYKIDVTTCVPCKKDLKVKIFFSAHFSDSHFEHFLNPPFHLCLVHTLTGPTGQSVINKL